MEHRKDEGESSVLLNQTVLTSTKIIIGNVSQLMNLIIRPHCPSQIAIIYYINHFGESVCLSHSIENKSVDPQHTDVHTKAEICIQITLTKAFIRIPLKMNSNCFNTIKIKSVLNCVQLFLVKQFQNPT